MNKQQLAFKIWESANRMRSKIEANEYKDYILGFIFYKFLSDKELNYLRDNDWTENLLPQLTENDTESVVNIQENLGYFIAYKHLFSTWIAMGPHFSADNVTDALSAFTRLISPSYQSLFDNIFATLQTGLSKLGETSGARTKAIRELIYLIKDIPMDGKQDYDVLGFVYEYLISNFAANAGKKAGEFYTPHEVSLLMSEIIANHLKNRTEIKIYDPTSGSGSLLINIGQCVARYAGSNNHIMYYAQELKENTYNLTRMNLVMRGILPANIVTRNGDTLEDDWPYFNENDPIYTYQTIYMDAVVSNPPYSQAWNPANKYADPRYARFGVAPKGKADYAFLLHDLYHLRPDGIMTIVLPHGVLFRGGEEGKIRRNLIEQNHIDTIIGLPANIFYGTGIPTVIMVLRQKRGNTDVLIVDASRGFTKAGKNNALRACDIKRIVDAVVARKSIPGFAERVERDTIRCNDYNLNIPRYVDSSEKAESWDIFASMFGGVPERELQELHPYWTAFPGLKEALFASDTPLYCRLNVPDLNLALREHPAVSDFFARYREAFRDFGALLQSELLDNMLTLHIPKEEALLSDAIFSRLETIPLVDRYDAYQLLDDQWGQIAGDLEILQTEGFAAAKQVDPNMTDGKEQGYWVGHILPFDLVQKNLLAEDLAALKDLEDRLSGISGQYESLLEELSEEDREQDFVNESKDGFIPAKVRRALKAKEAGPETLAVLEKAEQLMRVEKSLRAQIKERGAALHQKTKDTIENLSDKEVLELLRKKWIVPLLDSLHSLPGTVLTEFAGKLETLCGKYETTLAKVEEEIAGTERSLASMLEELTGDEFDMKGLAKFRDMLGGT